MYAGAPWASPSARSPAAASAATPTADGVARPLTRRTFTGRSARAAACATSASPATATLVAASDVTSAIGVVMGNFDVSVDENATNQVISAYPNPATDRVWLDIAGMTGAGELIIRDAMGRQVAAQRMQLGSDRQVDLNVSDLTNGAYLFELRDAAGKVRSFRVVVAR